MNQHAHHFIYTATDRHEIWQRALISFDTNILLTLYKLTPANRDTILALLKEPLIKNRIFVSDQVISEYLNGRWAVFEKIMSSAKMIEDKLESCLTSINTAIKTSIEKYHPFLNGNEIRNNLNEKLNAMRQQVRERRQSYDITVENDTIFKSLREIFAGRTGKPYSPEVLNDIYAMGAARYAMEQPPGYADIKKDGDYKYNDLIIWLQLLDECASKNRDLIFVTNDRKEDWWFNVADPHGQQYSGALPALKAEFTQRTNRRLLLCTFEQFVHDAAKYLGFRLDTGDTADLESNIPAIREARLKQKLRDFSRNLEMIVDAATDNPRADDVAQIMDWFMEHYEPYQAYDQNHLLSNKDDNPVQVDVILKEKFGQKFSQKAIDDSTSELLSEHPKWKRGDF